MGNTNNTPSSTSPSGRYGCDVGLNQLIKDRIVFIDTCSCLHDKFSVFINNLIPCLKSNHSKLYIAYKCVEELIRKTKDAELADKANYALSVINDLSSAGLIEIRGKASDSFADSSILQNLLRYKEKHNLLLITQDQSLATDAVALNRTLSVSSRGHTIKVRRINSNGNLTGVRTK
jgi:hypothetical protein